MADHKLIFIKGEPYCACDRQSRYDTGEYVMNHIAAVLQHELEDEGKFAALETLRAEHYREALEEIAAAPWHPSLDGYTRYRLQVQEIARKSLNISEERS